ncbi:hypothetical protein F4780DRAFT_160429 [Xylariomycetidae sp. FL0641]|nr:hypothetical protein F4780DRAFT_160429 [Xylariomycetidae sp. FL0641]
MTVAAQPVFCLRMPWFASPLHVLSCPPRSVLQAGCHKPWRGGCLVGLQDWPSSCQLGHPLCVAQKHVSRRGRGRSLGGWRTPSGNVAHGGLHGRGRGLSEEKRYQGMSGAFASGPCSH